MNIHKFIFGAFFFLLQSYAQTMPVFSPSELSTFAIPPEQAVQVLQSSNDAVEIYSALKSASSNAQTRTAVFNYLRRPNLRGQLIAKWRSLHPQFNGSQAEALYGEGIQRPLVDVGYFQAEQSYGNAIRHNLIEFIAFLASSKDPGVFDVFREFNRSSLPGMDSTECFAHYAKGNDVVEPLFLDYIKSEMFSGSQPTFRGEGILIILSLRTNTAYQTASDILASDEYWKVYGSQGSLFGFSDFRYDKNMTPIFLQVLLDSRATDKVPLIEELFRQYQGPAMDPPGPIGQQLDSAVPDVYPQLLAFIVAANKLNLPEYCRKLLSETQAKILKLYAQRNMTPPTAEELETILANVNASLAPKLQVTAATPASSPP